MSALPEQLLEPDRQQPKLEDDFTIWVSVHDAADETNAWRTKDQIHDEVSLELATNMNRKDATR